MIAVDTNLLVYAHRAGCAEHGAARKVIEGAANDPRGWGVPFSCVLEFWSVVTHPSSLGGESTAGSARGFLQALIETGGATIFPPAASLVPRCLQIAEQLGLRGARIFDVQVGLCALEAGATEIWTHDAGFIALPGLKVLDPLRPAGRP